MPVNVSYINGITLISKIMYVALCKQNWATLMELCYMMVKEKC